MTTVPDTPKPMTSLAEGLRARLPHVRANYRLHPMVAIYLITVITPIWTQFGALNMSFQRIFLLIVIIPLFIQFLMGRAGRFIASDYLFVFAVVWMLVSLNQTTPHLAFSHTGSVGMEMIGGYLIGRLYIRSREDFFALCRWLVTIVLCLVPLAIHETRTGRPLIIEFYNSLPGPFRSNTDINNPPRMGLERAQTVFAHPIHSGLFASIVFSLCFVALKDVFSTPRRLVSATMVGFVGFAALSSGALLALMLQFGLIIWAVIFRNFKNKWRILMVLLAIAYVVVDILSTRTPVQVAMSYATFSAHNAYWRAIIADWGLANILGDVERNIEPARMFGIGMNNWVRPHFMHSGSMDNFWLVIGVRYGIPGAMATILGYGLITLGLMRRDLGDDQQLLNIRRALVFTFLGLAFTLYTVHVWTQIYSFVFFILGAAAWVLTTVPLDPSETGRSGPGSGEGGSGPEQSKAHSGPRYSRYTPRSGPVRSRATAHAGDTEIRVPPSQSMQPQAAQSQSGGEGARAEAYRRTRAAPRPAR